MCTGIIYIKYKIRYIKLIHFLLNVAKFQEKAMIDFTLSKIIAIILAPQLSRLNIPPSRPLRIDEKLDHRKNGTWLPSIIFFSQLFICCSLRKQPLNYAYRCIEIIILINCR